MADQSKTTPPPAFRLTVFGPDDRILISVPLTEAQALAIDPYALSFEGDLPIGGAFLERIS